MDILYKNEDRLCSVGKSDEQPIIEKLLLDQGQELNMLPATHQIVFVKQGQFRYWTGEKEQREAQAGELVFFPSEHRVKCLADMNTSLVVMRFYDKITLCDDSPIENIIQQAPESDTYQSKLNSNAHLAVNGLIANYFNLLESCCDAGLHCRDFYNLKLKELLCILHAFYSKDELALFFQYAITPDSHFSQFILSNYYKYNNLSELSNALNYTISGFEKRFKRVFKQSPYRWMKEQKAREIFHVIRAGEDNFKEISESFGFNSTSQFNDFVKGHFGKTPGEIRKNKRIGADIV